MKIKGFLESSMVDWPGRISAVIFISGCNFSCPFCHNADLVKDNSAWPEITQEQVISTLLNKKNWLDGVVITGGEPCMSSELVDLIRKLKAIGFPVKLDTNGSYPELLRELLENKLIDYVAMDVKAPLNDIYQKITASSIDPAIIHQSIKLIQSLAPDYEFRTTFVPSFLNKEAITEIAALLKGSCRYYIQQFNPKNTMAPLLRESKPYTSEYLQETFQACQKIIPNAKLRD